jgi:RNA polymerase sigma-70 factor (ECF subfamily)
VVTVMSANFASRTEPYRRELLAHCYRMLGSVHDAEDLVQDTMLRAWRAFDTYDEDRASLRTWLYRIATNACLTALAGQARRPMPSGLGAPAYGPEDAFVPGFEVPWLQPMPDTLLADPNDPAYVAVSVGSLRLAIVAALQLLPPRQRAVLILRDVLDWPAADVADMLDMTVAAVNSALQRARARTRAAGLREDEISEPTEARAVVDRYVAAFENADLAALKRLLTDDAVLEMPPYLNWLVGADDYTRFIARAYAMRGTDWRTVPTGANGQPAVAAYVRGADGVYGLHTLQVFAVTPRGVAHAVVFQDPIVFALFGLTTTIPDDQM